MQDLRHPVGREQLNIALLSGSSEMRAGRVLACRLSSVATPKVRAGRGRRAHGIDGGAVQSTRWKMENAVYEKMKEKKKRQKAVGWRI